MRESPGGDSFGTPRQWVIYYFFPSLLFYVLEFVWALVVSACTVTQVNRGSLEATHTFLPKECLKMPLVALPASSQL